MGVSATVARNARLLRLPPRVALFYSRARRRAARDGDDWSLASATGPESLACLLALARGRSRVVEIGTGTAWTTAALALASRRRRVASFDPIVRPERSRYLALAGSAAQRIELFARPGEDGPGDSGLTPDFVFIDGSHERERTIATFEAWRRAAAPGAVFAFHDFANDAYPGVTDAIEALELAGDVVRDIFVWRAA